MSSTVREDDPLLSAGENALYISPDSLKKLTQIGEGEFAAICEDNKFKLHRNCKYHILLGQFGTVYKAKLVNHDGRVVDVAIKTIRQYTSGKVMDDFIREMTVMTQLIHPNIINLYGVVKESELLTVIVILLAPKIKQCNIIMIYDQQGTGLCWSISQMVI